MKRMSIFKYLCLSLISIPLLVNCGSSPLPGPTPTGVYSIVWKNYNGDKLKEEKYNYGDLPTYKETTPTKPSTEKFEYKFAGWSPQIERVTCDKVYTATYSENIRCYDIKWYNGDNVIETDSIKYGDIPTYDGPTPTKSDAEFDYKFIGWSPNIVSVTGPASYYAQFSSKIKTYEIKWYSSGTLLETDYVEYGKTPSYLGPKPTKDSDPQYSYDFIGWSPNIVSVTGPASYYAQFSSEVRTYNIKWYNGGDVIKTDYVKYGDTPHYDGPTPTKKSEDIEHYYDFTGWSPNIVSVTGPASYYAQFDYLKRPITTIDIVFPDGAEGYNVGLGNFISLYKIDWGDGTIETQSDGYHKYPSKPTSYTIIIIADFTDLDISHRGGSLYSLGNKYITSVVVGNNITSIDAFGCISMKSINIPPKVKNFTFYGCSSLSSPIVIPSSVTCIRDSVFHGCSSLTSITISNSVTSIGDGSFAGCTSLQSISIPNSVTSIGRIAFYGCSSLTSLNISSSVTSIGDDAFYGCSQSLMSLNVESGNIHYDSRNNCNALIEKATDKIILGSNNAFIPEGIKCIGANSFDNCTHLKSIHIPSTVTSIHTSFIGCSSIESISVDLDNELYHDYGCNAIFHNGTLIVGCANSNLKNATFYRVGAYAFSKRTSLKSVELPNSVSSIESRAFEFCTSLNSFSGYQLNEIAPDCLEGCSSLTSIKVSGNYSDWDCNGIFINKNPYLDLMIGCKNTKFPNYPCNILKGAFKNCTTLDYINIPGGVHYIGKEAFFGCSLLQKVSLDEFKNPNFIPELVEDGNQFIGCHPNLKFFVYDSTMRDAFIKKWKSVSSDKFVIG